jgi:hypothetical protein
MGYMRGDGIRESPFGFAFGLAVGDFEVVGGGRQRRGDRDAFPIERHGG